MKLKSTSIFLLLLLAHGQVYAQLDKWQKGVVVDEFIYDTASFPQAHSATIVETPAGLVAAWFGGTREGNPDVEIYVSHFVDDKWTAPVSVACWDCCCTPPSGRAPSG